jgi:hypothetical protein
MRMSFLVLALSCVVSACSNSDEGSKTLMAGAASRSVLPTVDGARDYLSQAPGWPAREDVDPDDPGVFIEAWDQGQVDVGNGRSDSAWVHDDLRASAVALAVGEQRVLLIMADTYSYFGGDIAVMLERVRPRLPEEWTQAPILVSATHNHHGPDTAFSINDDWFSLMADEIATAAEDAVAAMQPATMSSATGDHGYGADDVRDPIIRNTLLNILAIEAEESGESIATLVQWTGHPESTLGWDPPAEAAKLDEVCPIKGWTGGDCSAEGRYLTADYPGVLRERLQARLGGEVLYFNGPLGNQVGPGNAPTWVVDEDHPVGDGLTVPEGAVPLTACEDRDTYLCRSFAKTESIGTELANAVGRALEQAAPVELQELSVRIESFYTRLTNIGFRALIPAGDIGWSTPVLYNCTGKPFSDDNCVEDGGEVEEDVLLAFLGVEAISKGDVIGSQIAHVDFGNVGILFMPGELPPELVKGLPDDFATAPPEKYYREPHLHAVGADYEIPGHFLSLVDEDVTLTVGLGGDQIGYFVPISDYRLKCLDEALLLAGQAKCDDLYARGVIEGEDWLSGAVCQRITDDESALQEYGDDADAVAAICRYGQALGREIDEPDGHYEETNAAGWDMVEDLWEAAKRMLQK